MAPDSGTIEPGTIGELPSGRHPALTSLLELQQTAAVGRHLSACCTCRTRLALYATYEDAGGIEQTQEVHWIAERLALSPPWSARSNRFMDALQVAERFIAAVLLLCATPILAAVCAIIVALSRSWPTIRHERVGWWGRPLKMLKLRTMWGSFAHPRKGGPDVVKATDDPRVTSSFAALCRRFSIDELPQLWHIVTGQMSFVGPRPLTARELRCHYSTASLEILSVRPGMAGLWQVLGRSRLTYAQRRRLDLFYIRHRSVRLYFHILIRAVPGVLKGKDAW